MYYCVSEKYIMRNKIYVVKAISYQIPIKFQSLAFPVSHGPNSISQLIFYGHLPQQIFFFLASVIIIQCLETLT